MINDFELFEIEGNIFTLQLYDREILADVIEFPKDLLFAIQKKINELNPILSAICEVETKEGAAPVELPVIEFKTEHSLNIQDHLRRYGIEYDEGEE